MHSEPKSSPRQATATNRVVSLAEELIGSSRLLTDDEKAVVDSDPEQFDELCMKCEVCDWWCEPSELDEDQVCEGCNGYAL